MTPRLLTGASLRWNAARAEWLMTLPESVVVLNETAAAVLSLCDLCGYLHEIEDGGGPDVCERCGHELSLALTELLESVGAAVLGPIGWPDEALSFIEENESAFDCVVLDVDLHGLPSYPVAEALARRGIHFVFTTGYDAKALHEDYRRYPRCEKPIQEQAILAALALGPRTEMTGLRAGSGSGRG